MTLSPRAQDKRDRIARAVRTQLHTEIGEAYERLLAEYPDVPAMFARRLGLLQAQRIVTPLGDVDEPRCEVCGCTQGDACEGGCSWATRGLGVVCSACVVPVSREPAECSTVGCGVLGDYLDISISARSQWVQVRPSSTATPRWYCRAACAAGALTAGTAVRPGKVTPAGGGITQAAAGAAPLLLRWDDMVTLPGPGSTDADVRVMCSSDAGAPATLVLDQKQRLALAGLLDLQVRDIDRPCGRPGCGTPVIDADSPTHPRWWGWAQIRVVGVDVGPQWACSPPCVSAALARAGVKLAAADEAAEIEDQRAGDSVFGTDSGLGW